MVCTRIVLVLRSGMEYVPKVVVHMTPAVVVVVVL